MEAENLHCLYAAHSSTVPVISLNETEILCEQELFQPSLRILNSQQSVSQPRSICLVSTCYVLALCCALGTQEAMHGPCPQGAYSGDKNRNMTAWTGERERVVEEKRPTVGSMV